MGINPNKFGFCSSLLHWLDKLKEHGDYDGLLRLAKDYYDGNGMDEEQTYKKTCQNRGDDLLIEDKDFAVVYNGSVGGTYEVFAKYSEQNVRNHVTRYGIGRASEDVREVAREMTHVAFTALATRKLPILHMPNDSLLYLQYNKEKDSIDVGTVTNIGLSVKHSFPYDHEQSIDMNIQGVHEQLQDMKEYQQEEYVANRRRSERRADLARAIPSEEEEDKVKSAFHR